MNDDADLEAIQTAQAFKPKRGPLAIAMTANVLLAAICLGVPYWRGHAQARAALHSYARFASCLLGAEAQGGLGLGMPPGDRDHFAGQVLHAGADWPQRCVADLRKIAPEEAVFLWPSVKVAGGDVRAVVALSERELNALSRQRQMQAAGHVPSRPLLALGKLRAALALFAKATNADGELDADAVRFAKPAQIVTPARLPIMAGSMAALQVWAAADGLHAVALDGRGISWLSVVDGKIDRRRMKRTSLVRTVLRDGDEPLIVWAMSSERCKDDESHCLHRATGLARFDSGGDELPQPAWFAAHPAARADHSVHVRLDGHVDVLALRDASGMVEVRRYELGKSAGDDAPPQGALERYAPPDSVPPTAAMLLPGQPPQLAYLTAGEAGAIKARAWSYDVTPVAAPVDLGELHGEGGFVQACEAEGARFVAFGTRSELAIARIAADGSSTWVLPATQLALGDPLHVEDPAHDKLKLSCRGERATLVLATSGNALLALQCDAAACKRSQPLARDVALFDAVQTNDALLVAYAQRLQPQITVARLAASGEQLEETQIPAACWDPDGGMCGQPTFAADSGRVLLCGRDSSDLLAIESDDGGHHWKPMSGLQGQGGVNADPNAPMRQHRLRKGLD